AHGADEGTVTHDQPINLAFAVRIEHHFHGADEILDVWPIAKIRRLRQHRQTEAAEELQRLGADQAERNGRALLLPFARGREHAPEQVYVERAAQATVGAHDDESHRLYRALDEEWMPIVGVCFIEVADHDAHLFRVRTIC